MSAAEGIGAKDGENTAVVHPQVMAIQPPPCGSERDVHHHSVAQVQQTGRATSGTEPTLIESVALLDSLRPSR